MSKINRMVIAGGGTGGHLYPGLAVADAFKSARVLFIGSHRGMEASLVRTRNIPFRAIAARPLMGQTWFGKLLGVTALLAGWVQSIGILLAFRPRVIFATGGYTSVPILLAGFILRIPSLILEQNVLPGRATRFLSRFVSRVLVSFEESKPYLPGALITVTGNPIRSEIGHLNKEEGCRRLGIPSDLPVVSVMGASQGAQAINRALLSAIPKLKNKPWQILHLTGTKHYTEVTGDTPGTVPGQSRDCPRGVPEGRLRYRAFPYVEDMAAVYGASDLLVARAGATTLAEIMKAGKPAILIPYPYAADNHQEMNARWLESRGGCRVVLEHDLSGDFLARALSEMMENPQSLRNLAENAKRAGGPDALPAVIRAIEETVR